MISKNDVKANTALLERLMGVVNPSWISDFNLSIENQIRFTRHETRFICYRSGHVTIVENGVEITGTMEARDMEKLLFKA